MYDIDLPTFDYIWLIFMVNIGIYTSPMDAMGLVDLYRSCLAS